MNRVYRVVWCHIRNTYVVASELASRKKVKSSKQVSLKAGLQVGAVLTAIATMGIAGAADLNPEQIVVLDKDGQQIVLNQEAIEGLDKLAIVLGSGAKAPSYTNEKGETKKNNDAVVIGNNAETNQERSIAIGSNAKSTLDSVVIGNNAQASLHLDNPTDDKDRTYGMTIIGAEAKAEGKSAMALGFRSESKGTNASAIGGGAKAMRPYSTAIGATASALANNTVAIGVNSVASGDGSSAIGMEAKASSNSTTAIGLKSEARAQQSIAVGAKSIANEAYTVSFGHDAIPAGKDQWGRDKAAEKELNRRLVHVAKGRISENSTDAINGSQLYASNLATVEALGGGAELHDGTIPGTIPGSIKGPSYVFNDKQYTFHNVGDALYNLDGRIDVNKGNITNILEGKAGLVQLDGEKIIFDNDLATEAESFDISGGPSDENNKSGDRKLTGLKRGEIKQHSTDAINGSQLLDTNDRVGKNETNIIKNEANLDLAKDSIAQALGGGAGFDKKSFTLNKPDYNEALGTTGKDLDTVEKGLGFVNGKITAQGDQITNITEGTVGLVKLGDKNDIVFDADLAKDRDTFNVGDRKISNLAAGVEDKDAVNVSQLNKVDGKVEANTTNIAKNKTLIDGNTQNITQMGDNIKVVEGNVGANTTNIKGNTANITLQGKTLEGVAEALGGDSSIDSKTGELSMPNYKVALDADPSETVNDGVNGGFEYVGGKLTAQGEQITNIDDRVITNTGNIKNITEGTVGLVKVEGDNIVFDSSIAGDRTFDISNGTAARTLTGVKKADLSATSTDAVNGSQLFETNTTVNNQNKTIKGIVKGLGPDAKINDDGTLTGQNYKVALKADTDINSVYEGFGYVNEKLSGISAGAAGLIKLSDDKTSLMVDNTLAEKATSFNIANGTDARTLTGVAEGAVKADSVDAINGSQLHAANTSIAKALGGDSTLDGDGNISAPTYTLVDKDGKDGATKDFNDVGSALNNLDGVIAGNTTNIKNISGDVTNLMEGTEGLIKLNADKSSLVVDNKLAENATSFNIANGDTARTLTGVEKGSVKVDSVDAINGSQLYDANQNIANVIGDAATLNTDGSIKDASFLAGREVAILGKDGKPLVDAQGNVVMRPIDGFDTITDAFNSLGEADQKLAEALGGGTTINKDGSITGPTYIFKDESTHTTVGGALENLDGRVDGVTTGTAGLVKLDGEKIIFDNDLAKGATSFDISNGTDARTLTGVANGVADNDAVNVSQLTATTEALGGGTTINADGSITGPTYNITNIDGKKVEANDVGTALETIDGNVVNNTKNITNITTKSDNSLTGIELAFGGKAEFDADGNLTMPNYKDALGADSPIEGVEAGFEYVGEKLTAQGDQITNIDGRVTTNEGDIKNITSGKAGLVQLDGDKIVIDNVLAKDATSFDLHNGDDTRKITGVSAGTIGKDSTDAITGGQLYDTGKYVVDSLGGTALVDVKTGEFTGPDFADSLGIKAENGTTKPKITTVAKGFEYLSNNLGDLNTGKAGLLQLSDDGKKLVFSDAANSADTFDLSNDGKTRTLTSVTAGKVAETSTDAINGSQLHATNKSIVDALGGGSKLDENGNITGPTYNITNVDGKKVEANDVGTALETIDGNVVNNTKNITSLTNNVNNINNGTAGLVKVDGDKIVFDSSIAGGRTFDISNNGEARTLTGVKDGALAADSKDAVNGGQLHATNQNVAQNSDNVGKLAESLGGGASVGADGKLTGPTYTFTDNSVHTNVGSALENLDGRVDGVEKKVDGIANGTAGLVKLSDDGKSLVIDNGLAKNADSFDISNGDKDRTLTGVADGKVKDGSKDAINGGQLHASNNSIADIFGGGASVDKDGYVSMPSYELGADKPFNNVGDSLTYLSNSMKNGDGGLFKLDRENNQVILEHKEINEKTTVNIGNRVMTGVANGNVAEGSLDAVNGGQLWTTNQQVSSNTNQIKHIHNTMNHYNNRLNHVERTVHQNRKVASAGISGAMAMSSIPYVEHTKYSLGMGVASYDGEAAMSIGLTFKVGDNGRFRIQGSYDTQNKMGVGAGIAFEL